MKITLTKPQHRISSSNKRFRVLISGRRFGKTYLAITEMMKYAAIPNQKIWYVAPTLKMAKDICWSNLKEVLNQFNWIEDINETTLTITVRKTNSTISLKKTEEFGRVEINEHKIYIKFGCNEDHSTKTPASYIIIK